MHHKYRCRACNQWIKFFSDKPLMLITHGALAGLNAAQTIKDLDDPGPPALLIPNFKLVDKRFGTTAFGNLSATAKAWITAMETNAALPVGVINKGAHRTDPVTMQERSKTVTVTEFYIALTPQSSPHEGARGVLRKAGNRVDYFYSQGHLENTYQYKRVIMEAKAISACNGELMHKKSAKTRNEL